MVILGLFQWESRRKLAAEEGENPFLKEKPFATGRRDKKDVYLIQGI